MIRLAFGLVAAIAATSSVSAQTCAGNPVAVQILGSGGPAFNAERASASYLLWVGGQAKLLFDIGGGAHLRFSQAGAKLNDLAMVGISHLHPTSDLPALMWASNRVRSARCRGGAVGQQCRAGLRSWRDCSMKTERSGAGLDASPEQPGVERRASGKRCRCHQTEPTKVLERDGLW
jgi:hypothetical protein